LAGWNHPDSGSLTNRLVHLDAFQTSELYKVHAMGLPVRNKPRIICCAENLPRLIAKDTLAAHRDGRKVMVLSERTNHLSLLWEMLRNQVENCFILHGRLSKKQRTTVFTALEALDGSAPRVLLATGRLVGEGFDHPPLDTLVLAMPISWKGTLQQYAGRLHREHADKQDVRIHDYAETDQPQLARMWDKRKRGYRAMGYAIRAMDCGFSDQNQQTLEVRIQSGGL
jgi:superfamily II DNA or RNA helicase